MFRGKPSLVGVQVWDDAARSWALDRVLARPAAGVSLYMGDPEYRMFTGYAAAHS